MVFEFEAIDEEEDALGVAGAQEELDDGRRMRLRRSIIVSSG